MKASTLCSFVCAAIQIIPGLAGGETLLDEQKNTNSNDIGNQKEEAASDDTPRYWLMENYPNPETDPSLCGTSSQRLCDPDSVLNTDDAALVVKALEGVRRSSFVCPDEETEAAIEIQYAVALAKNVDLSVYSPYEDEITKAAEAFARGIHDDWGIGMRTDCGGTGILLFLSVNDRAIYFSRGKAMERIFTNPRLDQVIEHMKPLLREESFKEALVHAIKELDGLLERGEPEFWERMQDLISAYAGLFWILGVFGFTMWSTYRQKLEQRRYAQVASHLDEIDRARALALQGQYKAVSCPICLEAFQKDDGEEDPSKGSDGRPIKLLRCGHVFDESCWEEWISSGQGQVNKCPICKHDIGRPHGEQERQTNTRSRQLVVQDGEEPNNPPAEQRALRQYNFERQFRLARLSTRFPRYIGSQQIQRWTQSTYDGTLARDPSFVNSNPGIRQTSGGPRSFGSSRTGGGSGFGGGSSAGGRGSRW